MEKKIKKKISVKFSMETVKKNKIYGEKGKDKSIYSAPQLKNILQEYQRIAFQKMEAPIFYTDSTKISLARLPDKGKDKQIDSIKGSKGIQRIILKLRELKIPSTTEAKFDLCRDERELPFDIIIFVNGKAGIIEYDGKQHFEIIEYFHNRNGDSAHALRKGQTHDIIKNKFARDNNFSLMRISYIDDDKIETLVQQYVTSMKNSSYPVIIFSNPIHYKLPYGIEESQGGCLIM
jgi:hypothetical protein